MVIDAGWRVVGQVVIDNGLLALVDPGYAGETIPGSRPDPDELVSPLVDEEGHHLGLLVSTGYGDGVYEVEVRGQLEDGEPRIAEVRIVFT